MDNIRLKPTILNFLGLVLKTGLCTLVFSLAFFASPHESFSKELAIIAHKNFPKNSLSLEQVKKIFLGEKTRESSVTIKIFDQKDKDIAKPFFKKVMESSILRYRLHWIKQIFREGMTPPEIKKSSAEVITAVKRSKGGIGYVWESDISDFNDIKVLLIIDIWE